MQQRIRAKDLVILRGNRIISEDLDNRLTIEDGDKILLNKELSDNFNLTKSNSVKVPLKSAVNSNITNRLIDSLKKV